MLVIHANWSRGALRLWGESLAAYRAGPPEPEGADDEGALRHWFAASPQELRELLEAPDSRLVLRLPCATAGPGPCPSDRLEAAVWRDQPVAQELRRCVVPCLELDPVRALRFLLALDAGHPRRDLEHGHGLRFFAEVARLVCEVLIDQRYLPSLEQTPEAGLRAHWQPWLHDGAARARVVALLAAMPAVARAADDEHAGEPWRILSDAIRSICDATVRSALMAEDFAAALEGRDRSDPHVAWLGGLLGSTDRVDLAPQFGAVLLRDASDWVARLDDTPTGQPWRLCLRVREPPGSDVLADLVPVPDEVRWRLTLHLVAPGEGGGAIDATEVWRRAGASARIPGQRERLDELLLRELARAARIFRPLEAAMSESAPSGVDLTTHQACELLCEHRSVLEESGITVESPPWWDSVESQLAARLLVDSEDQAPGGNWPSDGPRQVGLSTLVRYRWQVAVGDQPIEEQAFGRLLQHTAPLVRLHNRWVLIPRDQLQAALRLLREQGSGELPLQEVIQMAHGLRGEPGGLRLFGVQASGWVGDVLEGTAEPQRLALRDQPGRFCGELRPYQRAGLSWLAFLDAVGMGACLADDMGLGKTIQIIALLQHERQQPEAAVGPTLLIVPTSLIANWTRELSRFAPELRVHVHHGPARLTGALFAETAERHDVVISTYGLVARDGPALGRLNWHRVVLDEAQSIKNPPTKQTTSIRALRTVRRVALTGTPVENRLSELWSIMEFCNPGYLGTEWEFRRRFAIPVERHRDLPRADLLRRIVRPFILRRVKTDPAVLSDLPPCVHTREDAYLTAEQAAMYQHLVDTMLRRIDGAEGMERRGLVLAALVRLKQVCDHPRLVEAAMGTAADGEPVESLVARSGKMQRLLSLMEEVAASGERALIFTQFRQMVHLSATVLEHALDREVLLLHGGLSPARRQQVVDRFQAGESPALVLSLKVGGVGLNLTAATHVFHYDRWWNPAVEAQATDRAYRIGQDHPVQVHKFVCVGTLEERIDQMIEQKTDLAQRIIGAGEQWLTELSTSQLRDLLVLRASAVEGEP
jgi:non-specific serine/threonine protein kinase